MFEGTASEFAFVICFVGFLSFLIGLGLLYLSYKENRLDDHFIGYMIFFGLAFYLFYQAFHLQ